MPQPLQAPWLALSLHDLQLLALLLEEGSVTRAAERSGQTQPAVSRKLQRLRESLGDPLLVRSGARLAPTERGAALREPLREVQAQIARMQAGDGFDPARSARSFVIASADSLAPTFLPQVIAQVVAAGPQIACHVRPVDPNVDIARALDSGEIDLVISNEPRPREDLRTAALYQDEVVCLLRAGHPAADDRRLTLARYLRLAHLVPHAAAQPRAGPIDGALAQAGYLRRASATLPEFNQVPYLLMRSDLVFTTARRFAEHYTALLPLVLMRAPHRAAADALLPALARAQPCERVEPLVARAGRRSRPGLESATVAGAHHGLNGMNTMSQAGLSACGQAS